MPDAAPEQNFSRRSSWKRLAIVSASAGAGGVLALSLILWAYLWFSSRPHPWDNAAVTAKFKELRVEEKKGDALDRLMKHRHYTILLVYDLTNTTMKDYELSLPSTAMAPMGLRSGSLLSFPDLHWEVEKVRTFSPPAGAISSKQDKIVELPDGRIVAFPAKMSDDEISAVIRREEAFAAAREQIRNQQPDVWAQAAAELAAERKKFDPEPILIPALHTVRVDFYFEATYSLEFANGKGPHELAGHFLRDVDALVLLDGKSRYRIELPLAQFKKAK